MARDPDTEHETEGTSPTAAAEGAAGPAPGPGHAELEARCAELEERWLRAQADYQNLRRRSQADVEAALRRTVQPLLADLLLVLDFLDMALSSPATNDEARNLALGVQLTRTKLLQALEASGLEEIPVQAGFDPNLHEAAGSRTAPGASPGAVLETARKGYRWRGQVLRPAQVIVAAEPAPGADAAGEGDPLA